MNESNYIGGFNKEGEKDGQGKLYFAEGGSYLGGFLKNRFHGFGKLFYPSGRLAYEGFFNHNNFNQHGKIFSECPTYIDNFDYRDFSRIESPHVRKGIMICLGQDKRDTIYWKYYEGEVEMNRRHRKGVLML